MSTPETAVIKKYLETEGIDYRVLTVRTSWPEYLGYGLLFYFCALCLYFVMAWLDRQWTEVKVKSLEQKCLLPLISLYGSYSMACHLGWVWLPAYPFALIFAMLLLSARFLHKFPHQVRQAKGAI